MKQAFNLIAYYFIAILICVCCKKPPLNSSSSTPGNPTPLTPQANRPPVAFAGPDITVYYDLQTCNTDQVNLDGRNSTDPDGTIVFYSWTGPGLFSKPDSAATSVRPLSTGQHRFILLVSDDKGGSDRDTMIVNVISLMNRPAIDAQLVPFATLSEAREGVAVGSAGNKIVFAGAASNSGQTDPSTRVDIYDINTNSWSVAELSAARQDFSVVTSGNKIFFAGGWEGNWWEYPLMFTNVDIYDAATDLWSVKHLSEARAWVGAASAGNKVFFAGGTNNYQASSKVDIYDTETNTWSTSKLSEPRSKISTQVAGNKVHFAGGSNGLGWVPRATVDVYDNNTGLWSVSSMNEPKSNMKSFAMGSKILWAGGSSTNNLNHYTSGMVEIRDVITQSSSFSCLHVPRGWDNDQKAVVKNNYIVFFTGYPAINKFDIYDIANNSWSIGVLNQNIAGAAVISVNNTIYVAGGYVNGSLSNVVWKLEF
ncbi:MAG TPA: kelch repeat-containing protein [Chitinophagaceae bacterium]|nr:kelch repeat-containing protein [Chitinophagaceae bacterium]